MRIVTFSEARNALKSVLDNVVNDADCTIITRRNAEDAVVMSMEYYNSLMETVHLLKSPANAAHLAESIVSFRQACVKSYNSRCMIGCQNIRRTTDEQAIIPSQAAKHRRSRAAI